MRNFLVITCKYSTTTLYSVSKIYTADKLSNFHSQQRYMQSVSGVLKTHQIFCHVSRTWHVPPTVRVLVFLSVYSYRCYCSDNSIAEIRQATDFSSMHDVQHIFNRNIKRSTTGQSKVPRNGATSTDPHSCELLSEQFSDRCPSCWKNYRSGTYDTAYSVALQAPVTVCMRVCGTMVQSLLHWLSASHIQFQAILFMISHIMRILRSLTEVNGETGFTMIGQGGLCYKDSSKTNEDTGDEVYTFGMQKEP
jgi:hypothetical protein